MSWYINDIVVDSHEKLRGTKAYNYFIDTYDVSIKLLDYGDYLFHTNDNKSIVFEFKTCKDFISSMENKSLFQELSNQTINNEYSYLVICGDFEETFEELYFTVPHYRYKYKSKYVLQSRMRKQVQGAIYRIYAMYIPIIFADDENDAFDKMLKVSSKVADAKKYGGVVRPVVDDMELTPMEIYLTTLNGIGEKKAKNITNELSIECLEDLCGMKPSDFLSVDKVNKNNVIEIWKNVHNESLDL